MERGPVIRPKLSHNPWRPSFSATAGVVPLPAKQSRTKSPGFDDAVEILAFPDELGHSSKVAARSPDLRRPPSRGSTWGSDLRTEKDCFRLDFENPHCGQLLPLVRCPESSQCQSILQYTRQQFAISPSGGSGQQTERSQGRTTHVQPSALRSVAFCLGKLVSSSQRNLRGCLLMLPLPSSTRRGKSCLRPSSYDGSRSMEPLRDRFRKAISARAPTKLSCVQVDAGVLNPRIESSGMIPAAVRGERSKVHLRAW